MPRGVVITPEEQAKALAAFDAGETYEAIGRLLGVTASAAHRSVKRGAARVGRETPRRRPEEWYRPKTARDALLVADRRAGMSWGDLGRKYGLTPGGARFAAFKAMAQEAGT